MKVIEHLLHHEVAVVRFYSILIAVEKSHPATLSLHIHHVFITRHCVFRNTHKSWFHPQNKTFLPIHVLNKILYTFCSNYLNASGALLYVGHPVTIRVDFIEVLFLLLK